MRQITFLLLFVFLINSCADPSTNSGSETTKSNPSTPVIDYVVINYFGHDTTLFTEGLLFHNGQIFESAGSPKELPQTKSVIGITDLATGRFDAKIELDKSKYFGEGIVFFKNKLYQLTYQNQIGFIYDEKTFKKTGEFKYSNIEGWGMTTDRTSLIMSDGSNKLTYLDPGKLTPLKTLEVTEQGYPVDKLNELEYIKGFLYANIWTTNMIVKIDPASGHVVGKMDMSSLTNDAKTKNPNADVLNGIAYDSTTDKVYVTGKLWPTIYQIQFSH